MDLSHCSKQEATRAWQRPLTPALPRELSAFSASYPLWPSASHCSLRSNPVKIGAWKAVMPVRPTSIFSR
eukprot:scaffold616515_cov28-Prasinocladus_malaysianus.AAC.1